MGLSMAKVTTTKHQNKTKLRVGDEIQVSTGKANGQKGKIDRIDFKKQLVYISGVNTYKRHTKPTNVNSPSGILDKVMPVHWSNVNIIDPKTSKPTRIGYRIDGNVKDRIAKGTGTVLSVSKKS